MDEAVERENLTVLFLVQALLGNISKSVHGVAVEVSAERVIVHFAVDKRTEEIDADIEEVLDELEGQYYTLPRAKPPLLEAQVYVGPPDYDWPGRTLRVVYRSKEGRLM